MITRTMQICISFDKSHGLILGVMSGEKWADAISVSLIPSGQFHII